MTVLCCLLWLVVFPVCMTFFLMLPVIVCELTGFRPDGRPPDYLERRLESLRAERDAVCRAFIAQCEAKAAARRRVS